MRYAGVLGTVALTELLAHFLSLGWGMMTLLAAFAMVALSGASTAAKSRSTEARLNALIPAVFPNTGGTINGSVQVNGNHNVSGTLSAGSLQGTLPAGYVSGTVASANTANSANSANTANSVSGLNIPQGRAGGLTGAPSSYTQAWGNSVVSFCTQVNGQLQNAGVFS